MKRASTSPVAAAGLLIPLLLALLLLGACAADPAADAPAAEVSAPSTDSSPTPDATQATPPAAPTPAATGEVTRFQLAADSSIGFVGSKVTGQHEGGFRVFKGEVSVVDGTPEGSSVNVVIDTTSLWSDSERLTDHLKSADFFEVETYPTATFNSTSVVANDDGNFTVTGDLDLHGVTKQISFPADIQIDDGGLSAHAEFSIKRFDFGIVYEGRADDLIRDDVLIKLDLRSTTPPAV